MDWRVFLGQLADRVGASHGRAEAEGLLQYRIREGRFALFLLAKPVNLTLVNVKIIDL